MKKITLLVLLVLFGCTQLSPIQKTIEEITSKTNNGTCFFFVDGYDFDCYINEIPKSSNEIPKELAKEYDQINKEFQDNFFNLIKTTKYTKSKDKLMHKNTLLTITYNENKIKIVYGQDNVIIERYGEETYYTYDSDMFEEELKRIFDLQQDKLKQAFNDAYGKNN